MHADSRFDNIVASSVKVGTKATLASEPIYFVGVVPLPIQAQRVLEAERLDAEKKMYEDAQHGVGSFSVESSGSKHESKGIAERVEVKEFQQMKRSKTGRVCLGVAFRYKDTWSEQADKAGSLIPVSRLQSGSAEADRW